MNDLLTNPVMATAALGALWGALTVTVKALLNSTEKRIEEKFSTVHGKIAGVAEDLKTHTEHEEQEMWPRLDKIRDDLSAMKLANSEAHAALGERLARTEAKLPNGALTDVLRALAVTLERPPVVRSSRRRVSPRT